MVATGTSAWKDSSSFFVSPRMPSDPTLMPDGRPGLASAESMKERVIRAIISSRNSSYSSRVTFLSSSIRWTPACARRVTPLPVAQLAEGGLLVDGLLSQEGEAWEGIEFLEIAKTAIRSVYGALARRMAIVVESHRRNRLTEGDEEANRITHAFTPSSGQRWTGRGPPSPSLRNPCSVPQD